MSQENQQKKKYSKWSRIFFNSLSILLIVVLIGWGLITYFHLNDRAYTDDAQVEEYINPINTRIVGYIKEIKFDEHQHVHKGDTLVVIDDREYKIQLQQSLASLQDAQAGKTVVAADVNVAENSTSISDANLAEAKARLDNQATNLKRYENLLKSDVISQYQYDEVKTDYDALQAKYNALLGQRQSTTLNTKTASQKLNVSDASILRARSMVEMAQLNVSYCYITAPYNGIMGRRKIAEGQLLQPGQTIATIVQDGEKWITANYTEKQIDQVHVGDLLDIKADALKGIVFEGRVDAISGATGSRYSAVPVDNATGNFIKVQQRIPVKIVFTENNKKENLDKITAGMNVQITKKK
ncbi:membrane fusion protein, multidrug efflux system [Chitinophaga costaii]|uniref:Membrane fusion protein, multidrug efflux system n=1 Tax=Chitinophaga costaii TaxID=1335309 RepID=A0A1C4DIX8_9BACT|nr:HlyD family secretion protein [Chitinophaga costaii]PUZ24654.1 HlyD family secretion protein [Chitinophaga costaii]SCC31245.1 membrane fusion protein, multidrug efflux system [Chitinophaga costaii]